MLLLPGVWNDAWAEQHHRFNGISGSMDLVDATAYGFNEIDVHRAPEPIPFVRLRLGPRYGLRMGGLSGMAGRNPFRL
jgi:hypothetical protein